MNYSYSHKGRGVRNPKKYQDPVLWAWLFFTPWEASILKQHIISCHIFWLNTIKGAKKSSHCGSLEAEQAKRCQKRFLTPKR